MLQLQIELATGKSVKIKHLKPLSSNVGGSAPSRFVGRVGCSGFGDLPGVGHFPWAKGEMEAATISYSMMGDRHRCYKDGKDKCILTAGHPACDDCRMKKKTHRGGHRRGGRSNDQRHSACEGERRRIRFSQRASANGCGQELQPHSSRRCYSRLRGQAHARWLVHICTTARTHRNTPMRADTHLRFWRPPSPPSPLPPSCCSQNVESISHERRVTPLIVSEGKFAPAAATAAQCRDTVGR